jgi:hypothetical protein
LAIVRRFTRRLTCRNLSNRIFSESSVIGYRLSVKRTWVTIYSCLEYPKE